MTQTTAQIASNTPRVSRYLAELDISSDAIDPESFAARLSQLIDLPTSLKIAHTHGKLLELTSSEATATASEAKTEFLTTHAAIVDGIIKSYTPSEQLQWAELPNSDSLRLDNERDALKPYIDFYLLHQKQILAKVKRLRNFIRNAASGLSPELAQLVKLDMVLDDTLIMHSRQTFTKVSNLLSTRFFPLLQSSQAEQPELLADNDSSAIAHIHTVISNDIQAILLAEVEVHMLPILGLIEAIEEETE